MGHDEDIKALQDELKDINEANTPAKTYPKIKNF